MKTLVIKMNDLSPDAAGAMVYPVQLFFDDGKAGWLERPLATINIPQDLSIPDPPLDPIKKVPIDGQKIHDEFLKLLGSSPLLIEWGRYLYQLLFQGDLAQEWNRLRGLYAKEAWNQSEGLRTILDIKPDTLRWLPWELIFQTPPPLFFDAANPFSRGSIKEEGLAAKTFMWPIHALIVVGSKKGDSDVMAEKEIDAIQRAFIKSPQPIDWHVCCRPTKAELIDLITDFKPQIFHFIGHGKKINEELSLELTDKNGGPTTDQWTVGDVSIDIKQGWQPRFAFINACRSSAAAGKAATQENSWDIARAFSEAGVPAVVGMQADIHGEAAAEFAGKFYESMLNGQPTDQAVAKARAAVKNLPAFKLTRRDWALATLYLQQLPEQILVMEPVIDEITQNKFKSDSRLKEIHDFVGRRTQRRKLWHGVDEIEEYTDEFSSACIVVGNEQMGKTALVQASMKICALRNRNICYVDIGYQSTKEIVEVLKIIREGDPKSSEIFCAPLPVEPFADFDNKHRALLYGPDPYAASKSLAADNNLCEQFFKAYNAALVTIAANEPLIIVLDHLSVEWQKFNSILVQKLLLPIAQNQLANCRLVLVCTATEFDKLLPKELRDAARRVDVAAWPPDKYVPLVRQICVYNDIPLNDDQKDVIESYSKTVKSEWGPVRLRQMVALLK